MGKYKIETVLKNENSNHRPPQSEKRKIVNTEDKRRPNMLKMELIKDRKDTGSLANLHS